MDHRELWKFSADHHIFTNSTSTRDDWYNLFQYCDATAPYKWFKIHTEWLLPNKKMPDQNGVDQSATVQITVKGDRLGPEQAWRSMDVKGNIHDKEFLKTVSG